ncbi:uncharacterized protein LOC111381861 [Olea europaea var. sylvestris]|uniref:uncharacterized protein LOC111381861 n=1 Tax=Olea europaea var. sylvestris TaxID=158386 RepID=UPI000C1D2298|nr:uncharacterized protein LOC111381861 [Olea europaea var. sylvestris]
MHQSCPKDDFSLSITELMVDATTGYKVLSFIDRFFRYNQIQINPKDEELTSFCTLKGIYCYKVMPFGLKNAGTTYQRAMQKIFDDMLYKIVECYVDDLVVKTKRRGDHLQDLRDVFKRLQRHQLKMNSLKYAFSITSKKFLEPRNVRELKSLQGKFAYIQRFISNITGRCHPFNKLVKKDVSFEWDDACQNAFQSIKQYFSRPPVLTAPVLGKPLTLYITAQEYSLGALLIQVNNEGKENVLYYLSRTVIGSEMKSILSVRIGKWALLSSELDIKFIPQKAIKGYDLTDFFADHSIPMEWKLQEDLPDEEVIFVEVIPSWRLYFDGVAQSYGARAGVVFVTPHDLVMPYSFILMEKSEYEVLNLDLKPYHEYISMLMRRFDLVKIKFVPRSENREANTLVNWDAILARSDKDFSHSTSIAQRWVFPSLLPSNLEENNSIEVLEDEEREDWRQPIIDFLQHKKLPDNPRNDEATQVVEEAHSGICGAHQFGPKLHFGIKRMWYYWPTMVQNSMDYVRKYEACQVHANFIHQPPEPLHLTVASWPFDAWGLDIIRPITPKFSTGYTYVLTGTDDFSKWAEAVPLKEVKKENDANFFHIQIIY